MACMSCCSTTILKGSDIDVAVALRSVPSATMLLLSPPEEEAPQGSNLDVYHGKMMNCLRKIKSTFNPRGRVTDKELWTWMPPEEKRLASLVVEYEESIVKMFNLDEICIPGWDRLESWIEKADRIHRQRMHYCRDLASVCGQDVGNTVHMKDLRMKYMESPAHRMVMRTYGPHWQSNLPGILRSYSASCTSLSQLIPLSKCRELAQSRTDKILKSWERLKRRKEEGIIDAFVEMWSQLDRAKRSSWLRSKQGVWDVPHQDVITWALDNQTDLKQLGSSLFLTAFLNVEDLSRPGYLPALLEARTRVPPQLFREFDSRSVPFGLYAKALPVLRCEGRMIFTNQNPGQQSYEISIEESSNSNWSALDPCNGLLSLEAQMRMYDFCLSCTPDEIVSHQTNPDPLEEDDSFMTLLDRCNSPDCQSPDVIDLSRIKKLLQASLDEAHDDLWQLRTNEEFWLQRMRETKIESCSSNMLLSVFRRIDTFTALCDLVDSNLAMLKSTSGGSIGSQLKDRSEAYAVMSLEAALLAAQNDILSAACHIRRPRGNISLAMSKLLELVMEDSPVIRIIGLSHVLRVIDREMRIQVEAKHPFALIKSINDLAVIAFSLNQVGHHYLFAPSNWYDHFQKLDELEDTWNARSLPWHNLIKMSLDEIDSETLHKLDKLFTRDNVALEDRHFQFWTIVDQHIEEMSWQVELQYSSLLEMLRQTRPARPTAEKASFETSSATLPDPEPTLTAKQRGKRRAQSIVTLPSEINSPQTSYPNLDLDLRPVIPVPMGIRKAWTFWHNLIEGGPESPKEFSWQDFIASMAAIGYAHETTTGSVYRFEYMHTAQRHAINLHRPHGNMLNAKQARRQWRDRIFRRIRLELVED